MKNKGVLLVVSGPSGVGKGTVCQAFLKENPEVFFSVSATTRKMRETDVEGVSYYFKSKEEFASMIAEDAFLEWATFCENSYGTPKQPVLERLNAGTSVLLEIDVQGALQVKRNYPDAVLVFILPPSLRVLESRLRNRGTETEDRIQIRMQQYQREFEQLESYEYLVVNDNLEVAVSDLAAVLKAEQMRTERCHQIIEEVLTL